MQCVTQVPFCVGEVGHTLYNLIQVHWHVLVNVKMYQGWKASPWMYSERHWHLFHIHRKTGIVQAIWRRTWMSGNKWWSLMGCAGDDDLRDRKHSSGDGRSYSYMETASSKLASLEQLIDATTADSENWEFKKRWCKQEITRPLLK